MDTALALIEQIIEEHKQIIGRVQALDQVTNDTSAMLKLDKAQNGFMPGRLDNQKQVLQNWQESLATVDTGLQAHFDAEETGLLTAFEKHGGQIMASALRALLVEHQDIRNRLAILKKDVSLLEAGESSREVWESKVWGLRVYTNQLRKLFETHALSEQKLLRALRDKLRSA